MNIESSINRNDSYRFLSQIHLTGVPSKEDVIFIKSILVGSNPFISCKRSVGDYAYIDSSSELVHTCTTRSLRLNIHMGYHWKISLKWVTGDTEEEEVDLTFVEWKAAAACFTTDQRIDRQTDTCWTASPSGRPPCLSCHSSLLDVSWAFLLFLFRRGRSQLEKCLGIINTLHPVVYRALVHMIPALVLKNKNCIFNLL